MTHTPGPWENYDLDWDMEREIAKEQRMANAAPALLEALQELLFRVNRNDHWVKHSNPSEAAMRRGVVEKARAAIAQAKGETK